MREKHFIFIFLLTFVTYFKPFRWATSLVTASAPSSCSWSAQESRQSPPLQWLPALFAANRGRERPLQDHLRAICVIFLSLQGDKKTQKTPPPKNQPKSTSQTKIPHKPTTKYSRAGSLSLQQIKFISHLKQYVSSDYDLINTNLLTQICNLSRLLVIELTTCHNLHLIY